MHIVFFLAIIILLIILLSKSASQARSADALKRSIEQLNQKINELSNLIPDLKFREEILKEKPQPTEKPEPIPVVEKPLVRVIDVPAMPLHQEEVLQQSIKHEIKPEIPVQEKAAITNYNTVHQARETWFQKWLRNNPDIEKFIGENLINKIGIAVLILGIAFFVKYAIDQEWINQVGRVCIGLICGIILIILSFRLRKNYRSFSSVLVGGGLTVFYFTIAFAFHQYDLLSQSAAFIIMIIITAFAVVLSILYDRIELGIIATIGGFVAPFLVSNGQGNYVVLFTYLCILNSGLIVLALYKRWHALHFIAFAFTVIIFGAWVAGDSDKHVFPYMGTFLFGTVFYLMFVSMSILLYIQKEVKFTALDVALLIAVNVGYYASGIYLLQQWGFEAYKGLFTLSLGIINLVLAFIFYKRKNIDKNFIYLLIGVTLTFISLTAPVQLQGSSITIFWAAEMVLLFWLYQKSFIPLLKIASAIITILSLISLLMDWSQVYVLHTGLLPVIINKGFITTIFSGIAMSAMVYLFKKEADTFYLKGVTNNGVRVFYTICAVMLFFIAGMLEINYQFSYRYPETGLQYIYAELYAVAYFLLALLLLPKLNIKINDAVKLSVALLIAVYYLLNIASVYGAEKTLLDTGKLNLFYSGHWIAAIFFLILIRQIVLYVKQQHEKLKNILSFFTWVTTIVIIIFFKC